MTSLEFHNLYWSKKIQILCKIYIDHCGYNGNYWGLRKWFEKQPVELLQVLFDYLNTLQSRTNMQLIDVLNNAEKYRQEQVIAREKEKNVLDIKPYEDFISILEKM